MKTTHVFQCLTIALILLVVGPLHALQECRADREKFCKDVPSGKGQVMQCLQSKADLISQGCRQALTEKKEKRHAEHQACKADRDKFCPGVKPGEGRIHACMQTHQPELSATCQAQFKKREKFHALREACHADKEKFCKDVKPGEGRIKACMQTHEPELASECRNKIEEMKQWKASRSSAWEGIRATLI